MSDLHKDVKAALRARPVDIIMADLLLIIKNYITIKAISEDVVMEVAGQDVPLQDLITEVVIIQVEKNK